MEGGDVPKSTNKSGAAKKNRLVIVEQDNHEYSGRSYLEGNIPTELSLARSIALVEEQKKLKILKKTGVETVCISMMFNVIKPEIREKMAVPNYFEQCSLPLLTRATLEMSRASEKYTVEKQFCDLYENIKEHLSDWRLFASIANGQYMWVERICSSLGNLATIYRRRGWYAQCDGVMAIYKEMLDRHSEMICRRMAAHLSDDDEVYNKREMVNKYHLIAANLANNLKRPRGMEVTYRLLMQYEIDMGKAEADTDDFVWLLSTVLGRPKTSAGLAATSDNELLRCFFFILAHYIEEKPADYATKEEFHKHHAGELWGGQVNLAVCAGCQSTEPFLSTYKTCSRCKAVKYCGKDCQVAHYKAHKADCKRVAGGK